MKILIIEDEMSVRENLAEILSSEGYDVSAAGNGLVGFTKALKSSPDLVISDIMMPVLDGHDALAAMRQNPRLKHIPFIFLTASASESDFMLGKSQGADFYLTKPFAQKDLLKAIDFLLR